MDDAITLAEIHRALKRLGGFYGIYVPEMTYGQRRIDAAIIDVSKRWIRGFEIKLTRADFLRDEKYHEYTQFTSSLSLVCPAGLIAKEEVPAPYGLLYVSRPLGINPQLTELQVHWERKPKRYQRRDGLAWLYLYVKVIEAELPRLNRLQEGV
jgi:hypothetical protein